MASYGRPLLLLCLAATVLGQNADIGFLGRSDSKLFVEIQCLAVSSL
jgi:hypothetical protein